ncbi:expressed unknown protein [Seminavis robusta]|uniref:Uncharacterized protein n=1 Tax=Seminavis robusta TaxID=568900 RepID=A0A9N8DGE5_9STRA|nr:expressed unknown protein [Seminavis robusta]|eukprot:Sro129_g061700.1 n/a (162) ;mRNA; r:96383-96868
MSDSLQDYFSNLIGCGGMSIVSDNARSSFTNNNNGSGQFDWFQDCCSMDTTSSFTLDTTTPYFGFSRWESEPQDVVKRDSAVKRPRRRPLGEGSDNPGDENAQEDYTAIFLPTEYALDGADFDRNNKHRLPMRETTNSTNNVTTTNQTTSAAMSPNQQYGQ